MSTLSKQKIVLFLFLPRFGQSSGYGKAVPRGYPAGPLYRVAEKPFSLPMRRLPEFKTGNFRRRMFPASPENIRTHPARKRAEPGSWTGGHPASTAASLPPAAANRVELPELLQVVAVVGEIEGERTREVPADQPGQKHL